MREQFRRIRGCHQLAMEFLVLKDYLMFGCLSTCRAVGDLGRWESLEMVQRYTRFVSFMYARHKVTSMLFVAKAELRHITR